MSDLSFNLQDVAAIAAEILGAQPEDLNATLSENEIKDAEQFKSILKPYAVKRFNELREEAINKGFRQANKKVERLWGEVFNEDISGQKLEDLFINYRDKLKSNKPGEAKKENITLQKALQSEEIKQYINGLKKQAAEAEQIKSDFQSYKNLQSIKAQALNVLTENGANFSQNPQIKARQMAALESELKAINFKNENGEIIILDNDGQPLFNKETANYWNFNEYIKTLSPVDFVTPQSKENKNTFVPSEKGQNGNNYGLNTSQLKTLTYDDFKTALNSGDTEKANFIQEQMIKNYENSKQ